VAGKRGNNEGSISKRSDGLWEARITLENGKRKSFYAKTRQEAARKLAAALRDQESGLPVVGGKQTVGQYLTTWLDATKAALRPKTWRGYEQFVRLHIVPTIGSVGLV
jgi:integrase